MASASSPATKASRGGRYTNAILTDDGYDKVVDAAPGHVHEVRMLVVNELTKVQLKQMSAIGRRLLEDIASDATCR